jgi:hypothetical protein
MRRTAWLLPILVVIAVVSGCATKRIVSQWSNPEYVSAAGSFHRILVVGVADQDAIRRNFEDRLVAQLRHAGVDALPSYRIVAEPGKDIDTQLRKAAENAGADGALVTRLLRVEQHANVTPGYYEPYSGFGYYRWFTPGWYGGFYTAPRVYSYPTYYSETTLYQVARNDLVWTGTIRTIDPENADEAIDEYVQTVVKALTDKRLLDSALSQRR